MAEEERGEGESILGYSVSKQFPSSRLIGCTTITPYLVLRATLKSSLFGSERKPETFPTYIRNRPMKNSKENSKIWVEK